MYRTVLALFIFCIAPLPAQSLDVLKKMTSQEQFYLKNFFRKTVCKDHWGYALFFDKPASLAGFFLKCPSQDISNPYSNRLMKKGWHVWRKYCSDFSTEHFIICEEVDPSEEIPPVDIICKIYLINKSAFLHVLYENLDLFKSRLGDDFSPEKLLLTIEHTKTLTPHLNYDEGLLGVVLGFEVESALLFGKRTSSQVLLHNPLLQRVCSTQPPHYKIYPVAFTGNPESPQVQKLLDKYSYQTPFIEKVVRNKQFLELVLERFG